MEFKIQLLRRSVCKRWFLWTWFPCCASCWRLAAHGDAVLPVQSMLMANVNSIFRLFRLCVVLSKTFFPFLMGWYWHYCCMEVLLKSVLQCRTCLNCNLSYLVMAIWFISLSTFFFLVVLFHIHWRIHWRIYKPRLVKCNNFSCMKSTRQCREFLTVWDSSPF